jgi:predicted RNA binding protein YcfA (HicA-like mRNA interferase family)
MPYYDELMTGKVPTDTKPYPNTRKDMLKYIKKEGYKIVKEKCDHGIGRIHCDTPEGRVIVFYHEHKEENK